MAHYVDIADDFKDQWCKYRQDFADAAYIQETTLLGFNEDCGQQLDAIYRKDVHLVADYPFVVLNVPWVSSSGVQQEHRRLSGEWLDDRLSSDCKLVIDAKFRKGTCRPPGPPGIGRAENTAPNGEVLAVFEGVGRTSADGERHPRRRRVAADRPAC